MNHVVFAQDRASPAGGVTTAAATLNTYDLAGRTICVARRSGVVLTRENDTTAALASGARGL